MQEPLQLARTILDNYLEEHGQRKTGERYKVLEEIYATNGHFDVDSLFEVMRKKKLGVSRATVYNTIEVLLDCRLVIKHNFKKNISLFEKAYGYRQHDHLICEDCGKILEFCDPRIQQINNKMGDILNFKVTSHSLNLYGRCNKLANSKQCEFYKN